MEIKRQIVESKTPPSNKEVWWFDNNEEVLKRYYGGSWVSILSSTKLSKAVFSPFDIPDNEIWIIAPGAEDIEFPDAIYDENGDGVTLYGYYEYLLRTWIPMNEHGEEMPGWSVFYDADRSLYRLRSPKSQIQSLPTSLLPYIPKVDSVVIILPKSCNYIQYNAIDLRLYPEYMGNEEGQINHIHILITASDTVGISDGAFTFYADSSLGVSNVYLYIYSKEYTTDSGLDGDERGLIIDPQEGDINVYVYVQKYLVDEYENEAYYWGDATIKKLS